MTSVERPSPNVSSGSLRKPVMLDASATPARRSDWYYVGGILGLALLLRCIALDAGMWFDEIVTLVNFVRLPTRELVTSYSTLNNHILYSLCAQLSISAFGESPWALRLPAVLFGVASIAAFWLLAMQVVSRREAFCCALLMTLSYHHIWFSQNARGYTGLLLCTLVATSLFLRGIDGPTRRLWVCYGLVFATAMYLHLSAVFVFATHGLVYLGVLIRRARSSQRPQGSAKRYPLFGFFLGGMISVLLYAVLLPQMIESFGDAASDPSKREVEKWTNPLWTALETINSFRQGGWFYSLGVPIALGLMGIGIVSLVRRRSIFAGLALIHIPLTVVLLYVTGFRIWPRYFFVDGGFAILFLIHGTLVLSQWLTSLPLVKSRLRTDGTGLAMVAVAAYLVVAVIMLPRNYRSPKQDFVGARDFVEARRRPGDQVASFGLAAIVFKDYYATHWKVIETREQLQQLDVEAGSTWVVYTFKPLAAVQHADVMEMVQSDFDLVKTFPGTLSDGYVHVYRSRN